MQEGRIIYLRDTFIYIYMEVYYGIRIAVLITSLHPQLLREFSAIAKDDTDMSFNAVSRAGDSSNLASKYQLSL